MGQITLFWGEVSLWSGHPFWVRTPFLGQSTHFWVRTPLLGWRTAFDQGTSVGQSTHFWARAPNFGQNTHFGVRSPRLGAEQQGAGRAQPVTAGSCPFSTRAPGASPPEKRRLLVAQLSFILGAIRSVLGLFISAFISTSRAAPPPPHHPSSPHGAPPLRLAGARGAVAAAAASQSGGRMQMSAARRGGRGG